MEYDTKAEKFIGFVLPTDKDSIPDSSTFSNLTAMQLVQSIKENSKSAYVYTVMGQPVRDGASPFCVCVFGTDNKFNAVDVKNRLEYIKQKLEAAGINVLGVSSDGDSRLLLFMKKEIKLGQENPDLPKGWNKYFFADLNANLVPVQDSLHNITKLRNILTKPNSYLQLGKHAISSTFLLNLVRERPKGEHFLVIGDCIVKDKMNVTSALKLFTVEVTESLKSYYNQESKALILYLKVMEYVYQAFESKPLSIEERIYKLWYATFVLRAWKALENAADFITTNTYTCIEINAHSLIAIYVKLRDLNRLEFFKPWLYSSQACEKFYRIARSLTSQESTVINFTVKQFMHRVKRIEKITSLANAFEFKKNNFTEEFEIKNISNEEILDIMEKAKSDVLSYFKFLEIEVDESFFKIGLKQQRTMAPKKEEDDTNNEEDENLLTGETMNEEPVLAEISDDESEENDIDSIIENCSGLLEECDDEVPKKGYFLLKNSRGQRFEIRKGSFLYAYQSSDSVSVDRLYRFNINRNSSDMDTSITLANHLQINQWAVFKHFKNICHVLKIKVGKNIANNVPLSGLGASKPVSVYCNLFEYEKENDLFGSLRLSDQKPQIFPLDDLITTLPTPSISDDDCYKYFEIETTNEIQEILENMENM